MTPYYYSDGGVTLYNCDFRELVGWECGPVGALVTDPPYGTGAYVHDTDVFTPAVLAKFIHDYRSVAVFGWPENLVRLCVGAGTVPSEWIVWWPTNAEVKGRFMEVPVARASEHIALFGELREARGAPAVGRDDIREFDRPNARAKHHISPKGKRWGDVWTDPSPGLGFQFRERLHPNEKPVSLMSRLLQVVADGTVFDPFAGSGSTLVAAKALGRPAVGCEIDERHCETAANRLRQDVLGLVS